MSFLTFTLTEEANTFSVETIIINYPVIILMSVFKIINLRANYLIDNSNN